MGDHPGVLATNPCGTHTNAVQLSIPTVPPPNKQKINNTTVMI